MSIERTNPNLGNSPSEPREGHPTNYNWYNEGTHYLAEWIMASSLYKNAYDLFSRDKRYGERFLYALENIPYKRVMNDRTVSDNWKDYVVNSNSAWTIQMTDYYNAAMQEIDNLVNQYHAYIAALPVNQSAQLQDAGVNSSITGEGLSSPSTDMPSPSSPADGVTSSGSSYSNSESIMNGISSFVQLAGAIGSLASGAVGVGTTLLGNHLAKQGAYNAQELHDLGLAEKGITTPSPYRVLTPENTPTIGTLAQTARDTNKVTGAVAGVNAGLVDETYDVPIGTDPNTVQSYETLGFMDVLTKASKYKMMDFFGQQGMNALRTSIQYANTNIATSLEESFKQSQWNAGIKENDFLFDYYSARNGSVEGANETDLSSQMLYLRQAEGKLREFEIMMNDRKMKEIEEWSKDLSENNWKTPYYYAALFGFNMQDTFIHQSGLVQSIHYGMEALDKFTGIIDNITNWFDDSQASGSPESKDPDKPKGKSKGKKGKGFDPTDGLSFSEKMLLAKILKKVL